MTTCIIYALCDPDTKAIRYVGQTVNPNRRLSQHLSTPLESVAEWIANLRSIGKRPLLVQLEECDQDQAFEKEIAWIKRLTDDGCSLLNITLRGGDTYTDTHPRQSFVLTPEQWAALDALAAELASPSLAGRSAGQPSWRTLMRDIADGKLAVVPAEDLAQEREDRRDCEAKRIDCINQLGHVLRTLAKGRTSGHDWMAAALDAENSILDFLGYTEARP